MDAKARSRPEAIPAPAALTPPSEHSARSWLLGEASPAAQSKKRAPVLGPSPSRSDNAHRWQELQDALREDWKELTHTLEDSLQDHFQRQELLMNQYALQGSQPPPLPAPESPDRCKSGTGAVDDATPRATSRGESRRVPTKQSDEGRVAPLQSTKEAAAQTSLKSVRSTGAELALHRRRLSDGARSHHGDDIPPTRRDSDIPRRDSDIPRRESDINPVYSQPTRSKMVETLTRFKSACESSNCDDFHPSASMRTDMSSRLPPILVEKAIRTGSKYKSPIDSSNMDEFVPSQKEADLLAYCAGQRSSSNQPTVHQQDLTAVCSSNTGGGVARSEPSATSICDLSPESFNNNNQAENSFISPLTLEMIKDNLTNTQRFSQATMEGMDSTCLMETYKQRRMMSMKVGEVRKFCGEGFWRCFGEKIKWWMALQPPDRDSRLARCIGSSWFEVLSATIVAANCVVIILVTDEEAADRREDVTLILRIFNGLFVSFYAVELALKMLVHRVWFFCNNDMAWNLFDILLVLLALADMAIAETTVTMSHLRTAWSSFRIIRMSRILRMVRFVRYFSQLRLILNSLIGSIFSLFWSIIMLVFMFLIFAIVFVQGATIAMIDHGLDLTEEERDEMRVNFGSLYNAILTLFQATTGGDDWVNFYHSVVLTGKINAGLFLFFIAYAQFVLLNVIMGIFVDNAMKLATPDRETVALEQRKQDLKQAQELRSICHILDRNKTGFISEDAFMKNLKDGHFRARLTLLGLDVKHATLFFDIICAGIPRNKVPIESFVTGAMRLKGSATSLDLQTLMFGTKIIHENQIQFYHTMEGHIGRVMSRLDKISEDFEFSDSASNSPLRVQTDPKG